jgi:uncharacterized protein YjcR
MTNTNSNKKPLPVPEVTLTGGAAAPTKVPILQIKKSVKLSVYWQGKLAQFVNKMGAKVISEKTGLKSNTISTWRCRYNKEKAESTQRDHTIRAAQWAAVYDLFRSWLVVNHINTDNMPPIFKETQNVQEAPEEESEVTQLGPDASGTNTNAAYMEAYYDFRKLLEESNMFDCAKEDVLKAFNILYKSEKVNV